MGDMSCNCAFSALNVVPGLGSADATGPVETPQSSRSGRLSSSSPAQSIWLPGVDGLWSMAKARTCSTSESMFVFVEKLVTVGPAERCGGVFLDWDSLGCGDDGPERDLRAITADASSSTVKVSDDIVAPVGLLCDRRRRVEDNREDVVDADRRAELGGMVVGDAGSIVNDGSLSAACCRGPALCFPGRSTAGDGWGSEEEELLRAVEVCVGVVTIGGADLVGTRRAGGVSVLFSVGGEP